MEDQENYKTRKVHIKIFWTMICDFYRKKKYNECFLPVSHKYLQNHLMCPFLACYTKYKIAIN